MIGQVGRQVWRHWAELADLFTESADAAWDPDRDRLDDGPRDT